MSVYSMRALSSPKFTTNLGSPIVCIQTGFKWRQEEPCMFVSTLDHHLCVVSCVDGALLQSLLCPETIKAMSWLNGCLVVVIQQSCFLTLHCDDIVEDEQTMFSSQFTRINVKMKVRDVALIECMTAWPINRQKQMMMVCVGESADAQLIVYPIKVQNSIINRLSSMLLSSPSLSSPDNKYYECGRQFDRVQVVGERIVCFDDERGSLTAFHADTLLVDCYKKGLRGAVMVNEDMIFHRRSSRIINLSDDSAGRVDCGMVISTKLDRIVVVKHE